MRSHLFRLLLPALLVALGFGCAGAVALRGVTAGAAMRAVGGRALAAGAARAGAGRVAASGAARGSVAGIARGRLAGALQDLTQGGRIRPVLHVDRIGRISVEGRHLATLTRDGSIVEASTFGGRTVGFLREGSLYDLAPSGGLGARLGFLRASTGSSRSVLVKSRPGFGAPTEFTLRRSVTAEVISISDRWYEIRLLNGRTGWVWGPAIGLLLLVDESEEEESEPIAGVPSTVVLRSLRSIPASSISREGAVTDLTFITGERIHVATALVKEILPDAGEEAATEYLPVATLMNGAELSLDNYRLTDEAAELVLPGGEILWVEPRMLFSPRGMGSNRS